MELDGILEQLESGEQELVQKALTQYNKEVRMDMTALLTNPEEKRRGEGEGMACMSRYEASADE